MCVCFASSNVLGPLQSTLDSVKQNKKILGGKKSIYKNIEFGPGDSKKVGHIRFTSAYFIFILKCVVFALRNM